MMWGKSNPRKAGWYMCTLTRESGVPLSPRYVRPLCRVEYPPGNFVWDGLANERVIAAMKFPAPYQGMEQTQDE